MCAEWAEGNICSKHRQRTQEQSLSETYLSLRMCCKRCVSLSINKCGGSGQEHFPLSASISPHTINSCSGIGFAHYLRPALRVIPFQLTLFISITTWFYNFVALDIVPNVWVLKLEKLNLIPIWGLAVFGKFSLRVSCHICKMREILPPCY